MWNKIKEKYGELKTELILMAIFLGLFLCLNGPQLSEEAMAGYQNPPQAEETESESETETEFAETEESESETETETETETEPETEIGASENEQEFQKKIQEIRFGKQFRIPAAIRRDHHLHQDIYVYQLKEWRLPMANLMFWKPVTEEDKSLPMLQKKLETQIAEYDGDWSVYVKRLDTEEEFVINDKPMKSASVMKLFIMGAVYQAIDEGKLERTDEIMSLMKNMISVSDNESSNSLLYKLGDSNSYEAGIQYVDEYIKQCGFSEMTVEYNGFNNSATVTDQDSFNQVAAKDCGKLLESVYRRTFRNRAVCNEVEQMMLDQHTRYKIPKGLPEGVLCGNKTGEMDRTENDAAIIYSTNCDYILVVLSSDWGSKDSAIARIGEISRVTYEFLN